MQPDYSATEVRPGSGRVRVTELKHPDRINPTPVTKPCEDVETTTDLFLSPEKLESLCGTNNLSDVAFLEVCVDTRSNTLGNFGAFMPKLVELKLNDSTVTSVRDVGTSARRLQVLWMSRCRLQDLHGISSFTCLQELYVSYNYVSELSPVGMLENLKLLDLEGNDVDDLVQVQYLGLCGNLRRLTLEGNPVCSRPSPAAAPATDYSYRAAVRELIPQLRYLDDVRVEEGGRRVEEGGRSCWSSVGDDWDVFRDSLRGCGVSQPPAGDEEPADCGTSSPGPTSSWTPSPPGSRPPTGIRPRSAAGPGDPPPRGSRLGSADSHRATAEAETSTLTHGAGRILFCGNPVQAIRAKREKLRTAPARWTSTLCDLPHVPTSQSPRGAELGRDRADVFAELRAWREQHGRRLQAIERERSPQVLTIRHGDGGEGPESDEEGFGGTGSDSGGDGPGDAADPADPASPDSSFQSPSPDTPGVARLSLSPDSTPSPSPPATAAASSAGRSTGRSTAGFRARRLRPSRENSERSLRPRSSWNPGAETPPAEARLSRTDV